MAQLKTEEYRKGFRAGFDTFSKPLTRWQLANCSQEYLRGYQDGFNQINSAADEAFQSQYSLSQ